MVSRFGVDCATVLDTWAENAVETAAETAAETSVDADAAMVVDR